ncbi:MAG: HlyD family secretion protein [Candidatus Binatia bacterium]
MSRKRSLGAILVAAVATAAVWYVRQDSRPRFYTGFVEGEERVIRSEVTGRVVEVKYAEGERVPANAALAVLDDRDIRARIASKQAELAVLDADIATQEERVRLVESTWRRDVAASQADLRHARAAAKLAEQTFKREQKLVAQGVSSVQRLDEVRAARDETRSAVDRAQDMLARAKAEERSIAVARRTWETLRQKRTLTVAQLGELKVTHSKYVIHSPAVPTVVQTQFIWPGELAQPGTAIAAVLDPRDKYVQIYVPVADAGSLHVGQRVEIERDSHPGERVPGEISFIADKANFTPEKIETRSDRLGQVYRAKVRILAGVERFRPGTEGNVYVPSSGHTKVETADRRR